MAEQEVVHGTQPAVNPEVVHGSQPPVQAVVNVEPNGAPVEPTPDTPIGSEEAPVPPVDDEATMPDDSADQPETD